MSVLSMQMLQNLTVPATGEPYTSAPSFYSGNGVFSARLPTPNAGTADCWCNTVQPSSSATGRSTDELLSLPNWVIGFRLRKWSRFVSNSGVPAMLSQVTAVNYIGAVGNGRTTPVRLEAVTDDGEYVELVGKFSGGCDRGVTSLAVEALCAALAADLDLPVPEPFIVEVEPDFITHVPDTNVKAILQQSCRLGFGSRHLPPGFFTWARNSELHDRSRSTALAIYVFDCLVQNIDRTPENTNCLTNGQAIGIFDHEIALNTSGVLFWKPPWEPGGLDDFAKPEKHIFFSNLKSYSGRYDELISLSLITSPSPRDLSTSRMPSSA